MEWVETRVTLSLMLAFCLFSYRQGNDMVMNECVGHPLRTKSSEHSDRGVAAGVAVLTIRIRETLFIPEGQLREECRTM